MPARSWTAGRELLSVRNRCRLLRSKERRTALRHTVRSGNRESPGDLPAGMRQLLRMVDGGRFLRPGGQRRWPERIGADQVQSVNYKWRHHDDQFRHTHRMRRSRKRHAEQQSVVLYGYPYFDRVLRMRDRPFEHAIGVLADRSVSVAAGRFVSE